MLGKSEILGGALVLMSGIGVSGVILTHFLTQ